MDNLFQYIPIYSNVIEYSEYQVLFIKVSPQIFLNVLLYELVQSSIFVTIIRAIALATSTILICIILEITLYPYHIYTEYYINVG